MKINGSFAFPFGFYIIPTIVFEKMYCGDSLKYSEGIEFSVRFLKFELDVCFWYKQ